jgi:uncharacterized lipoprotein YajG
MSARAGRGFMLIVMVLGVAGCATGLEVRYPEAEANRALLASVPSRRVEMRPVTDRRVDTARVAVARDGQDVVTSRPVSDILGEALAIELAKNGHVVGAPGEVVLAADVEDVWLDMVRGHGRTQYVGKIVFTLTGLDGRTGEQLLTRRYIGIKRHRVDKPSDDVAREVLNAALARSMRDLATDPALVAAFSRATAAAAPAR